MRVQKPKGEVQIRNSKSPLTIGVAAVSVVLLVLSLSWITIMRGSIPWPTTLGVVNPEILEKNHPRLFFGPGDIPTLRAKAATTHQEIWIPIRDYVDSQLGTSPPSSAPPDGDLDTYRNFGNQLIAFAFACVISEEAGHCDLAKTYLLTYASWGQWGEDNHRDLGHAHMLLGNAIAYDWPYPILTPSEQQTVR